MGEPKKWVAAVNLDDMSLVLRCAETGEELKASNIVITEVEQTTNSLDYSTFGDMRTVPGLTQTKLEAMVVDGMLDVFRNRPAAEEAEPCPQPVPTNRELRRVGPSVLDNKGVSEAPEDLPLPDQMGVA